MVHRPRACGTTGVCCVSVEGTEERIGWCECATESQNVLSIGASCVPPLLLLSLSALYPMKSFFVLLLFWREKEKAEEKLGKKGGVHGSGVHGDMHT